MPKDNWFETWFDTGYYHLLYQQRDEEEAKSFVTHLMNHLNLRKGSSVCDLACGNGRHSVVVAQMGYHVVGLDLSPNNISEAQKRKDINTEFHIHDMRKSFKDQYFDLVLNLFTSFGYFDTDAEHQKTLSHISNSLKPGGTFIIDYLNAIKTADQLIPSSKYEKEGITFDIERKLEKGFIQKNIHISENDKSIRFREKVRAFKLKDFDSMLCEVGLYIEEVYGSYDLSSFNPNSSDRLIIISKKR